MQPGDFSIKNEESSTTATTNKSPGDIHEDSSKARVAQQEQNVKQKYSRELETVEELFPAHAGGDPLPQSATVYVQNENELAAVGATNNLRGLAANVKLIFGGSITNQGENVKQKYTIPRTRGGNPG